MSFQAAGASDRAAAQGIFVILLILSILSFAFTVPLSERYRASPIAAGPGNGRRRD